MYVFNSADQNAERSLKGRPKKIPPLRMPPSPINIEASVNITNLVVVREGVVNICKNTFLVPLFQLFAIEGLSQNDA